MTKHLVHHHPVHTAIALATLLFCHACAWGGSAAGEVSEAEQAPQAISPITITATKVLGGLPRNLGANSAGYSAREISEQVNVINTEDIVKYSPDTMTRKRYIGDRNAIIQTRTASVTSSARALVYADGFLLSNLLGNGFAYPARWNMVLPEEIQRVDFFFGPHSAAYPGNSTGTTVLMTTRMPQKFEATAKAQSFSEDFSQYGHGKTFTGGSVSATVGNKAGALSWLLGFNHLDSTGHPMNYATASAGGTSTTDATGKVEDLDPKGARRIIVGETSQEATRQNSFKAKLAYDINSSLKASYILGAWQNDAFNHTHSFLRDAQGNEVRSGGFRDGGTGYRIGSNAFAENVWRQTHWMNALSLKRTTRGEWDGEAAITVYRIGKDTQHTSQPDGIAGPGGAGPGNSKYGTVIDKPYGDGWHTLDLRGTWRPQGSEAARLHEAAFGYHFDEYKLDTRTDFSNATQGGSDWPYATPSEGQRSASRGTTRTQAVYLQDAWRFAPDWKLTPGLRVEHWQARDGLNQNLATRPAVHYAEQSRVYRSPKLALQYAVNDDWLLKAAVSRAYRMPTVTELFQAVSISGNLITNNPGLQAERVTSSELTAERGLDDGLLRVSLFTERVRNAIYRATAAISGGTTTATTNLDRVHTHGLTLAYQQRNALLHGLDLTGSLTYAHARTKHDADNPQARNKVFPGVPDWRATVVGTYHFSDRLNWTLAARYSGRQSNELDNSDIYPDEFGANSRYLVLDTRVTWALDQHYKLALGIDNLNNEKYYTFHPMPNRTVHLELRAQY